MTAGETKRIVPLEVKVYEQGHCFICHEPCEAEAYAHEHCCIAYADHKSMKFKEINADHF